VLRVLVLVGDARQLPEIEAGSPFAAVLFGEAATATSAYCTAAREPHGARRRAGTRPERASFSPTTPHSQATAFVAIALGAVGATAFFWPASNLGASLRLAWLLPATIAIIDACLAHQIGAHAPAHSV
jgi:hypothetical protein